MTPGEPATDAARIRSRLLSRNEMSARFFTAQAGRLARACQQMAERFASGGRLLAFGRGPYATDAQHVSVEFIHPVIVGKRALPALDLSAAFGDALPALVRPCDIVMGFGPPGGDSVVSDALDRIGASGAQVFAFSGQNAEDAFIPPTSDHHVHQELVEVLYHTLWETVHVFLEHRERGHDVGQAGFLYPFLTGNRQETGTIIEDVASSIIAKARDDERLRMVIADTQADRIAEAAFRMRERLQQGATVMFFGNGGSATDANDAALDCIMPASGRRALPAVSLAMEPANISAIANDVGVEAVFLRQLIAHARRQDVAVAISTSGGSANVIAALAEARRRGLLTLALLGYDGGEIVRRSLADIPIVVSSDYIPRIQEVQASIYHVLIDLLQSEETS
jgi:D-sedoheptulose 7-phosphate isomerase